ncbi:hypothetical protein FHS14_000381 [Paenibacillus baekrokdamisoli]|nr:hypothetical protein [Paenibacillus baekrokdamisoli]
MIRHHTIYMTNDNNVMTDSHAVPSLVQTKRQIERYGLNVNAQAVLVASRLMAA